MGKMVTTQQSMSMLQPAQGSLGMQKVPKGSSGGGVMQSRGCLVWGPKEQSWELGTSHPELLSAPSQCVCTRVSGTRRKEWRKHPSKIIIIKPKNREGEIGRMELDQFERRFVGSVKLSG